MAYRAFSVVAVCLVILAGCGDSGSTVRPPFVLPTGGTGGTGNSGTGGSGATGGMGSTGGTGAVGGAGSTAGTGGTAATGGTGATGGAPECVTNALCGACPDVFPCNSDNDCFTGWGCIPSGCETLGGAPMNQCQPLPGGFCRDNNDCSAGRTCLDVPLEGMRCVKQTSGCDSDFDCIRGFSCEGGNCVDRRVPCVLDDDCPVSYSCEMPTSSNRFCIRIYETCETGLDCGILAPFCEDIDGDLERECAGALGLGGPVCLNSSCGGSTVCEASGVGSIAACGQYGLCQSAGDCADSTFECLALWQDGRKECVKKNGSCGHITDCPVNQVCASARTGGAPACQAGAVNLGVST